MTIKEAKEIDIVDYLSKMGYQPEKIQGADYWYNSPIRGQSERTASFKVNRKLNQWYDWGEGKGGNLVDLGILLHGCTISELLQKLRNSLTTQSHQSPKSSYTHKKSDQENRIKIIQVKPIQSIPLIRYLQYRRIPASVYQQHSSEVTYELNGKQYYSIGFKNDAGGYELRNEYSKLSSSPKGVTFIDNGAKEVNVIEGFINYFSHLTMNLNQDEKKVNFLVLNSISFFKKNIALMLSHEQVRLFLDNDKAGQKCSEMALKMDPVKFKDERALYQKYDDLNDWLMHIGLSQRQRQSQKL